MTKPINVDLWDELVEIIRAQPGGPASGKGLRWKYRDESWFHDKRSWRTWNSRYAGTIAGTLFEKDGLRKLIVRPYGMFLVSRIVWALTHWKDPATLRIVHVNGDNADDRPENLRAVTTEELRSTQPLREVGVSGYRGVSLVHTDSDTPGYMARLKGHYVGVASTPEEAAKLLEAYKIHKQASTANSETT